MALPLKPLLHDLPAAHVVSSIPVETLRALIRRGELRGVRVGRRLYVAADDLAAFIDARRGLPPVPRSPQPRGGHGRFNGNDGDAAA